MLTLPQPLFMGPPEDYATFIPETECDPVAKPGVKMFRDFVVSHLGGGRGSITRKCNVGGPSGHKAGRAWDWMVSINDPLDVERVHTLFDWLLDNDQEMARRVGITYMIWANKVWRSYRGDPNQWSGYDGYDADGHCPNPPCRNPHTDHVHFSFSVEGADGQTSFYDWIKTGELVKKEDTSQLTPTTSKKKENSPLYTIGGFTLGVGGYMLIAKKLRKS